ncbi:MAG: glycosyltransferase family 1 protein [Luteibacter sp.]
MKIVIDMQGVQTDSRHRGIGRYCLALTRSLLEYGTRDHHITLLFNGALEGIDESIDALTEVAPCVHYRSVGPLRNTSSDNRANDTRREAAERVFSHALDAARPDIVWLESVVEGLADDALAPSPLPDALTIATLYDVIPLHDPASLGHGRARDWYMRRIDILTKCDLLLAISEWVRQDAIKHLGVPESRIVTIGAGVDPRFRPASPGADDTTWLHERFGVNRPFVMYSGGFDERKNVYALVEAYAALPPSLRDGHTLVVVGKTSPHVAKRFSQVLSRHALTSSDVVFTGFVDDTDLVRLYQACALFVFPSEGEGFGLPPLEAMACGAPVLVNDSTSLPEVVGNPEALFDARQTGAMTSRMQAVLTDHALASRLRRNGLSRAANFTWRAVAERTLSAMADVTKTHPRAIPAAVAAGASFPVYRVDAASVASVLPRVRQWPGTVVWSGPLPPAGPTLAADRYRLGGYARVNTPGTGMDWLALLEEDAIGVVLDAGLTDTELNERVNDVQKSHPLARQRRAEEDIATSAARSLSDDDLARVADALARSTPPRHVRWLVDITHIATNDLGTGVHRVVRSVLRQWLLDPPLGVRIEPILFREGRFHHAHRYACALLGLDNDIDGGLPGDLVAVTGNEVYVCLDWTMESLPSSLPLLRVWRRAGVPLHFVVYDLLPVTMPDAFHPQSRESFARWMDAITCAGDVLHCISSTTAHDVAQWLTSKAPRRRPAITHFPLGADAGTLRDEGALQVGISEAMETRPSLLMVGTVEPRKGHAQVLGAVDLLWESGVDVNLVIVGHRGWLVKELVLQLEEHPERGHRLFWLDDADDSVLEAVYRRSTVLVAASRGEGYGLPLIEAAQRAKPVIARSLPVFHEVAGDYPSYFDTDTAEGLATHIVRWLAHRPRPGPHPVWKTWEQSAAALARAVSSSRAQIDTPE